MEKKSVRKSKFGGTNFLISIYYQENHSWQGTIHWLETDKKLHFRSELELISLMQSAVQSNQVNEFQTRKWDSGKKHTNKGGILEKI